MDRKERLGCAETPSWRDERSHVSDAATQSWIQRLQRKVVEGICALGKEREASIVLPCERTLRRSPGRKDREGVMMDWGFTIGSVYFSSIDIIVFALCMFGGIGGAITGFADAFASSAGYIVGFFVSLMFTGRLSLLIMNTFPSLPQFAAVMIVFIVLFLIGYGVLRGIGNLLEGIMEAVGIDVINHLLGFFWGVVEAAIVLSVIIYLLDLQTLFDLSYWFDQSQIVVRLVRPLVPESISLVSGLV